jgi:hypothetical protein
MILDEDEDVLYLRIKILDSICAKRKGSAVCVCAQTEKEKTQKDKNKTSTESSSELQGTHNSP